MAITAQLYLVGNDEEEGRSSHRRRLFQPGLVARDGDTQPCEAVLVDVSEGGCLLDCSAPLAVGSQVQVAMAPFGFVQATIVRAQGTRYGLEFDAASPVGPITMATTDLPHAFEELSSMPPPRWSRRVRLGIIAGACVVTWSAIGAIVVAIL